MSLNVLFVGGTGTISFACAQRAISQGMNVYLLTRGTNRQPMPAGAHPLTADIADHAGVRRALADRTFDVVVDWMAFTADDVARDLSLFARITGQYVFISSASAYQTPPQTLPIRESTPLSNPFWAYSRAKIECERRLMDAHRESGFPVTIVRPSHTYDERMVPFDGGWTAMERMRSGTPVVVPGDGTSLWTMTHSRDFASGFVGLLGREGAIGEVFHITADVPMTWNHIYLTMAAAAGVRAELVHVASEAIAAVHQDWGAALLGDKAHSMIFDNTKIKTLVPEFEVRIPFEVGAREIVEWHDADPSRKRRDPTIDAAMDKLVTAYRPRLL
jgi:nucleoside-diphosphate-sugar epimerase